MDSRNFSAIFESLHNQGHGTGTVDSISRFLVHAIQCDNGKNSALPLLVVGLTGWIPNKDLEVGSKGPWPWGAIIGVSFIGVGLVGLLLPRPENNCEIAVRNVVVN